MPRMTNAKSAPVLDSADAELAKLDWVLFKQEQDARLWSDPDRRNEKTGKKVWYPGKKMYKKPTAYTDTDQASTLYRVGFTGNATRRICELLDVNHFHAVGMQVRFAENDDPTYADVGTMSDWDMIVLRCADCEVNWAGPEPCFVCGRDWPEAKARMMMNSDGSFDGCGCSYCRISRGGLSDHPAVRVDIDVDPAFVNRMVTATRSASESMQFSMNRGISGVDQWLRREMQRMLNARVDREFDRFLFGDGGALPRPRTVINTPRRGGYLELNRIVGELTSTRIVAPGEFRVFLGLDPVSGGEAQTVMSVNFDGNTYILPDMSPRGGRTSFIFRQNYTPPHAVWDDRITVHVDLGRYTAGVGTPEPTGFAIGEYGVGNPTSEPLWSRRRRN